MSDGGGQGTSGLAIDGVPVDRTAFHRAALDPSQSVVIEAAAGSGKTWLLVARIVGALLAGAAPSSILAITFTRKAAAEVRERLVRALEELAACDDARALALLTARGLSEREAHALVPRARDLLEIDLTASPPMTVDTFHGWFARIVRSAPLATGIPADFAIAENTGALMRDAWRRFLDQVSRDDTLRTHYCELLDRAESATVARQLLDAMQTRRNDWKRFLAGQGAEDDIGVAVTALARELNVDERALGDPDARALLFADPAFAARYGAVVGLFDSGGPASRANVAKGRAALEAGDFGSAHLPFATLTMEVREPDRAVAAAAIARYGTDGKQRLVSEARLLTDALLAADRQQTERDVLAINRAAFHCGAAYIAAYESIKRERALLDFDDLEWHAAELMSDDASASYVQARLDARYQHVLVDEFQDTNPLQWAVLKRWLAVYAEDADLAQARPSVFLVGDPKQSIYRFRRAEPRLFEAARVFLENDYGATVLRTDETRRVAPGLMDALNRAFARAEFPLFHPHRSTSHAKGQAWQLPLVEHRDAPGSKKIPGAAPEADAPVALRDVLATPRAEKPEDLHHAEARAIVDALRAIVGCRPIDDPDGGRRTARWGDVMILVRTRKRIEALEAALGDQGIPYASVRRGGLLETLEASDLCALLQALVAPFSDLALAHALRSPLFGCSDADLIRLASLPRDRHPHWWTRLETIAMQDDAPALSRAWRLLDAWRQAAATLPAHDLLDRIVHEGEWIERTVAATEAAQRDQVRANLNAYLELALEQDGGRFPSLPRFIDELYALAALEDDGPDEGDTDTGSADLGADRERLDTEIAGRRDAVRILTVHGAKGLEAPIVVIADAHPARKRKAFNGVLIAWPPDSEAPLHLSVYGKVAGRGRARDRHFNVEESHASAEDWNVLYVAATRAREVLLVAGCRPRNAEDDDSWYRRLESLPEWPSQSGASNGPVAAPGASPTGVAPIRVPVFRPPMLAVGQRRVFDEGGDASDDRQSRRIGTALHRVLELLGRYAGGRAFDGTQATAIAMRLGLSANLAEVVAERAARILGTPALQRYFVPTHYLAAANELELLGDDGQSMRIDRLVEFAADASGQGEVWILDYKSQHRNDGAPVAQAHVEQLALYRRAVALLYPRHAVRSALIFGDGGWVELRDHD